MLKEKSRKHLRFHSVLLYFLSIPSTYLLQCRTSTSQKNTVSTPLLLTLAASLAGFLWWRRRTAETEKTQKKETRSPFKFPDAARKSAKRGLAATTALPRNKTSNNKKNKAKRREGKARKAEQRAKEASKAAKGADGGQASSSSQNDQPSTAVLNYTYFDSARRDTILPTHKRPKLTAADVMKKEQESSQATPQSR